MTRNSILIAVLFLGAGLAVHAGADMSHKQLAQNEAKPAAAASAEWTAGEVRKVDKAAGKVTIKHGATQIGYAAHVHGVPGQRQSHA